MPTDTMTEMILGFSVILGVLLIYLVSLFIRTRKALNRQQNRDNHTR